MMLVDWTTDAESDLIAVIEFIAETSIKNAVAFKQRAIEQVESLAIYPNSGRLGRIKGARELISPHDRYCVVYKVRGNVVNVLRLIHGGQNWQQEAK